jgi:hypothetical protein
MIWQAIAAIETVWLLTIYGHRAFDAWDRASAKFDELMEADLYKD